MSNSWNEQSLLALGRGYQEPCILAAGVNLDLFSEIGSHRCTAPWLAEHINVNPRALTILLDALVAMRLLDKQGEQYTVPQNVFELLSSQGHNSLLPAARHYAILLTRWASLTEVVRTGVPITQREDYTPPPGALEAFIGAMANFTAPEAEALARAVPLGSARRVLDVGGGPATHTIAFLRAYPSLTAILFDRPPVVEIARRNLLAAGVLERVQLSAGDFYTDELPPGCDVAWVSAIIHMNSRQQNRELFGRVLRALEPNGRIIIRDHVMDESRTSPPSGALFAINMLTGTDGGGTYTFDEIRHDLQAAGFANVELLVDQAEMNCLVRAVKRT